MHHHTSRLIDDNNIFVNIDHIDCNGLMQQWGLFLGWKGVRNHIARFELKEALC
jgi:hypothetical protein